MSDKTSSYYLALNIYRRLTGDNTTQFDTVDDIWTAIDTDITGNEGVINIEELNVKYTSNGEYVYESTDDITAYAPVKVTVDMSEGYDYKSLGYDKDLIDKIVEAEKYYVEKSDYWKTEQPNSTKSSSTYFKYYPVIPANSVSSSLPKGLTVLPDTTFTCSHSTWHSSNFNHAGTSLIVAGDLNFTNYSVTGTTSSMGFYAFPLLRHIGTVSMPLATTAYQMFNNCYNLLSIGGINLSDSLHTTTKMFYNCYNLRTVPYFNTSNVTNMSNMFANAGVTTIPQFDCSSCTNMSYMFKWNTLDSSTVLEEVPSLNSSNVIDMGSAFEDCVNLVTLGEIDMTSATIVSNMLANCPKLTNVGGLKNFGIMESYNNANSIFDGKPNLTHDSMINIFNGLYDRASAGYGTFTLYFEKVCLDRISAEEKAIATNKGWIITY